MWIIVLVTYVTFFIGPSKIGTYYITTLYVCLSVCLWTIACPDDNSTMFVPTVTKTCIWKVIDAWIVPIYFEITRLKANCNKSEMYFLYYFVTAVVRYSRCTWGASPGSLLNTTLVFVNRSSTKHSHFWKEETKY